MIPCFTKRSFNLGYRKEMKKAKKTMNCRTDSACNHANKTTTQVLSDQQDQSRYNQVATNIYVNEKKEEEEDNHTSLTVCKEHLLQGLNILDEDH